jgi:hypothetical protein
VANSPHLIKVSLDKRILNEFASKILNEERVDEVDYLNEQAKSPDPLMDVLFNCECDNGACAETISMTTEMYVRSHRKTKQFIVVPSHMRVDIEDIKDRLPAYAVVEKYFPYPKSRNN